MNKALLAVAGVAVAGGVYYFVSTKSTLTGETTDISIPSISKSELRSIVKSQAKGYEASGFAIAESGDTFVLKAEDEQKVREFLFEKFASMMPSSYASALQPLKEEFMKSGENFVEGLEFDMKVIETNGAAQLEVTLKKLPREVQEDMERAGAEAQWFKDMLDRGTFAYILSMNKEGDVNGIMVKDINEQIKPDEDTTVDLKVQGVWAKFHGDINAEFKLQEGVKNISLAVQEREKHFDFAVQNIKGGLNQTSPLDQTSSSSIEKIAFNAEKYGEFVKFLMNGIAFSSKTETVNGFINSDAEIAAHNTHFKLTENGVETAEVTLNGFKFAFLAEHISKEAALAIQEIGMNPNPEAVSKQTLEAFEKMIKSGLTLKITALNAERLAVNAGPVDKELKKFSFTVDAQLKENSLDMKAGNPAQYIPFVKVNARLAVNDADLTSLVQLQPMMGMFTAMKKVEGELAVFNFAFVNGQMTINGQQLPF